MRRVVIVGNSGSGKTTLAALSAGRLGVVHVELDSLFHQAGWTPAPDADFRAATNSALDDADRAAGGWVVCGNYRVVRSAVWARADTVVWLDLPRAVVMKRILWRTGRRVVAREQLWNGNRESARAALSLHDPERSIVRWAWDGTARYRTQYEPMMTSPVWAGLARIRLRSPAEVEAWLRGLPAEAPRSAPR